MQVLDVKCLCHGRPTLQNHLAGYINPLKTPSKFSINNTSVLKRNSLQPDHGSWWKLSPSPDQTLICKLLLQSNHQRWFTIKSPPPLQIPQKHNFSPPRSAQVITPPDKVVVVGDTEFVCNRRIHTCCFLLFPAGCRWWSCCWRWRWRRINRRSEWNT